MAGGIWIQFGQFSFFLAGLFSDLLLVRLCLFLGYTWFILFNCLGAPRFPDWVGEGELSYDSLFWAVLGFYVHGSSFVRLLLDEREVKLTEEEEVLWRMFYRRSGISKLLFKTGILPFGEFQEFEMGEEVMRPLVPDENLYDDLISIGCANPKACDGKKIPGNPNVFIIIEGQVRVKVYVNGKGSIFDILSGEVFNFKYLNLFKVDVGFLNSEMVAVAKTRVKVFSISNESLEKMSNGPGSLRQAWYSIIIAAVSHAAARQYRMSDSGSHEIRNRDPIFDPVLDTELPPPDVAGSGQCLKTPFRSFFKTVKRGINLPFPFTIHYGVRHLLHQPPSGVKSANLIRNEISRNGFINNQIMKN